MAIELKICYTLSSDGVTLTATDKTGTYSALNTGGWGVPNPLVSTALTATITTSQRASDGTFGTATTADVFSTLPSAIGGSIDISATDAINSSGFADGIYKLIYQVTGVSASVPYSDTDTQYRSFHPSIDSCRQKLAADVAICSCNCIELETKFNNLSTMYRLLQAAECCGDLNSIQKYIDILTKICSDCGCGCK